MFKDHQIIPSSFNVICKPITQLSTRKADHDNGYYIVEGLWGSCFTRIATKKTRFEIVGNNNPRCGHTYTKIPAALANKTFFLYVNYQAGYKIQLPLGAIVVGLHQAQPHKTGGWWSQSCLIYSPTGEMPEVQEDTEACDANYIRTMYNDTETLLNVQRLTAGFPIRYIAVNEEGYYAGRVQRNDVSPISFIPATNYIGDFLDAI